jgi:uncharacterized protein (TIGR02246 family)
MCTMRFFRVMAVLVMAAGFGGAASRAAAATDDVAAIRQVLGAQQVAWNRGDVEGFMHGYEDSPETTFIGSSVRKGYQAILASYRKNYAGREQMGTLTFSGIDVRLLPAPDGAVHYAAVTGRFHLDRTSHGKVGQDDGVFSLLWKHTPAGWKIILDHSS